MAISETITGKHRIKQKNRYIIRNAAPPPLLTSNGNFQIFPKPTADPDAASIKPSFELKEPLFIILLNFLNLQELLLIPLVQALLCHKLYLRCSSSFCCVLQ